MKTGIIGGTGGMGRLFSEVFKKAGHEVLIAGRKTEITWEDAARLSDIVIISVPIRDTISVIHEMPPAWGAPAACRPDIAENLPGKGHAYIKGKGYRFSSDVWPYSRDYPWTDDSCNSCPVQ